ARDPEEALDLLEEHLEKRPPEEVYDTILLPALALARRDRHRGVLSADDEHHIHKEMRQILEEIIEEVTPAADGEEGGRVVVLGGRASDETDELGLRLLRPLLGGAGCRFEVLPADMLAAEVLERVGRDRPAVVCIADLPPVGLSSTRYLCKRLKAQYPELK